jgi:hypothetical protein
VRVAATTRIACPPERVFDTLADLRNEAQWNGRVSSAELRSAEPIGPLGFPGGGLLVSEKTLARQERRNINTASTRRDSLPVDGRPSLPKMLETYFSTARSVITSLSAMP